MTPTPDTPRRQHCTICGDRPAALGHVCARCGRVLAAFITRHPFHRSIG